jgi:Ca2+-binding EF-hand superfamily protein
MSMMFERMDRNNDGVIEGDEMRRGHHGERDDDDDHQGKGKKKDD